MNLQQRSLARATATPPTGGGGCRELPLASLRLGATARVVALDDSEHPETARRLYDLGFAPGTRVTALRRSPLGGPRIYRAEDYDIALRPEQARMIVVEPVG